MILQERTLEWVAISFSNAGDLQEMQISPLPQEDPLEEEMATCFSILAWKIPWTEEPGGLHPMGLQESDMA